VLLPPGYSSNTKTSYPVLYLMVGTDSDAGFSSYLWTGQGSYNGVNLGPNVEQDMAAAAAAGHPMIVVMTDDSYTGLSTNWDDLDSQQAPVNGVAENNPDAAAIEPAPQWQSYFLGQVVPFIDKQYRVETSGSGQFIAGASAGGGAAMSYVGAVDEDQHFHTGPYQNLAFGAAGSFSGADDFFATRCLRGLSLHLRGRESYWTGSTRGLSPPATAVMGGPDNVCAEGAHPPRALRAIRARSHSGRRAIPVPSDDLPGHADPHVPHLRRRSPQSQLLTGRGVLRRDHDREFRRSARRHAEPGEPTGPNVDPVQQPGSWTTAAGRRPVRPPSSVSDQRTTARTTPGQNCVNIYSGGSHSPAYWIPDQASFFNWLAPQANPRPPDTPMPTRRIGPRLPARGPRVPDLSER